MNIAILGATSHIAKGLIYNYNKKGTNKLFLFARSTDRLREFLKSIECGENFHLKSFDGLEKEKGSSIDNSLLRLGHRKSEK
jgi:short-subunit dehydrogenase